MIQAKARAVIPGQVSAATRATTDASAPMTRTPPPGHGCAEERRKQVDQASNEPEHSNNHDEGDAGSADALVRALVFGCVGRCFGVGRGGLGRIDGLGVVLRKQQLRCARCGPPEQQEEAHHPPGGQRAYDRSAMQTSEPAGSDAGQAERCGGDELPADLWRPQNWRRRVATLRSSTDWYDWAAVAIIVAYNPLANEVIPELAYVPANLLAAAGLIWVALRSGASPDLLGMRRDRFRRGLAVGGAAAALAVASVGLLTLLPWTRSYFADDRFIGVTGAEVLYEAVARIPLGTAIGEEIIFRGVLLGLFLRRFNVLGAVVATSVVFGLWHILPTLNSLETNPAGDVLATPAGISAAVAGAVLSTAVAGVVFAMLRFRATSVVAPIVLHIAINSSAYLAGWLVVSNGWAS